MNQVEQNIIASAAEELDVNYQDYAAWYYLLIHDCLSTFKYPSMLDPFRKADLEIYQNKAVLPTGLISITRICPTDADYEHRQYCIGVDYVQQGSVVIFSGTIEDGTILKLTYKAWKTNDGGLEIPERFSRMLIAYIGWKHCRRHSIDPRYPAWKMQDYKREYLSAKKGLA